MLIDALLVRYYEKHAQFVASADSQKASLAQWQSFWEGRTISEITPDEQEKFRKFLGEGRLKSSSIDRALSAGRAALNFAVKRQELDVAPHIFMTETDEERRSREPMGRPISPQEMALLFQAAPNRHYFTYMLLAVTTLARPEAILDLQRRQYDAEHKRINLNPPGRVQNKKFRPIVPVAPTLRPWLDHETEPGAYIVSSDSKRFGNISHAFASMRAAAGLDNDVSAYSFRHGMSREMRKRRVGLDEIGLFLGHRPSNSSATTSIYAPMEPEYCTRAIAVIEEVLAEVRRLAPSLPFDDPSGFDAHVAHKPRASVGSRLTSARTAQLREGILKGEPVKVLAERFGISDTAVYKHRRKLGIKGWY